MPSFLTVLGFASLGLALTVSKPSKFELWDSGKSNTIVWSSVNTDPETFDIYLSHMAAHPPLNSLLFSNVPKGQGSATVSGLQLPNGEAYQINLVAHNKPEQIYAQSQQFNVTGEAVDATKTLDGYTGPTYTSKPTDTKTTLLTTSTGTGSAAAQQTTSSGTTTGTSTRNSTGSNPTQDSNDSGSGSQTSPTASGTPRPTTTPNAAVANVASAPLAALVFGAAAFFL